MNQYSQYIRDIYDFPKKGIVFKDITPLLLNPKVYSEACNQLANMYREARVDLVAAAEARGFLFGPQVAQILNVGFFPIRKPGKLPGKTLTEKYSLEYGTDSLQIHADQIPPGARVLLVDDVLATGGTIAAAKRLVEKAGANVIGFSFLIELSFLEGKKALGNLPVKSLIQY